MKKFTIVGKVLEHPEVRMIPNTTITEKVVRVYTNEPAKSDCGYIEVPFMGKAADLIEEGTLAGKNVEIEGYLIGTTYRDRFYINMRGTTLKLVYNYVNEQPQPKPAYTPKPQPTYVEEELDDDDLPF